MVFSKLENFLANNIEGFFNKKFSSNLHLEEIVKNIKRISTLYKEEKEGQIFLPSEYDIYVSLFDYENFKDEEKLNLIKTHFYQFLIEKNCFILDDVKLHFMKDLNFKKGNLKITLHKEEKEKGTPHIEEGTIVAPLTSFKEVVKILDKAPEPNFASLHVYEGPDMESYLEIGKKQIHMGRKEQNEFILTDPNVSRIHAYICFKNGRHLLMDAGSLNGISIGDEKIQKHFLKFGDKIKLGSTEILYEKINL